MSRDVLSKRPALRRLVYKAMAFVAGRLPMPFTRILSVIVSSLMWALDPRGRKAVACNLAHFIPASCPEARSRAVRHAYRSFAAQLSEGLRIDRLPDWYLAADRLALIDPWRVFARRPLAGPAILVTVHSNWELMLAATHRLRLIEQVEAISLSHGDPAIDHLFERKRGQVGCRSLLLDRAPLAALRALKAGRILGILADRDYTGNGVRVPFAGHSMVLPLGPAALAAQTGAPIIPMYLVRTGPTSFGLIVDKPLHADPALPKQHQVVSLTEQLANVLTRFVAAAPSQWVAFHDAWRS